MVGLGPAATLSVPWRRKGVVGTTIAPSSGWSIRSSMPRSCMCGSFMTSGAVRTGHAAGVGASEDLHFAEAARPDFDERVGLLHMGDARGVGGKTWIIGEVVAAHRLQQVLPMRLRDDVDRDIPVGGRENIV